MTYLVKMGGYGKLWMPAPRNWEGIGMRNIEIVEISPEPKDIYRDVQGNDIVFWNRSGNREYRITFEGEFSTIHYHIDPNNIGEYDTSDPDYIRYTSPSSRIEAENQQIKDLAIEIVGQEKNVYFQTELIYKWVFKNLAFQGYDGATALSTLENMSGACGGHSFLYAALLRSIGIPARTIGGLTSREQSSLQPGLWDGNQNTMGTHVWNEIFLPNYGWVQSDSTAGYTHVFKIADQRIILFRGEDIELGNGYPLEIIPYFHMPQINFLGNASPPTQTIGDYLALEVELLQ